MKRIIALITVLLILVAVFGGCGGSGDTSSSGSNATGNNNVSIPNTNPNVSGPVVTINFGNDGFSIVRPSEGDYAKLATKIFKQIKDVAKGKITNSDDSTEVKAKEVLVGKTNRPETQAAKDMLLSFGGGRYNDYIICCVNGKVVVYGCSDESLALAVDKFVADFCSTGKISSDALVTKMDKGDAMSINGNSIGAYTLVLPRYNISYYVVERVNEFRDAIYNKTGFKLDVIRDNVAAVNDKEIVIGNCNRDGVTAVKDYETYSISSIGNTVYLNGGRNYSNAYAVTRFLELIETENNLTVKAESDKYDTSVGEYKLVWTDEFESFNTDVWQTRNRAETYQGSWYGMTTWRSNKEENLRVEAGNVIHAASYDDKNFYGTWMDTASSIQFIGGFFEMSSMLADGAGLWHCFWVFGDVGNDEYMELDIMECPSYADYYMNVIHEYTKQGTGVKDNSVIWNMVLRENKVYSFEDYWKGPYKDREFENSMSQQFHNISCDWGEEDIVFYLDGYETTRYHYAGTETEYLYKTKQHHLILSLSVGANKENEEEDDGYGNMAPDLDADYWYNGKNEWTIDYVQIFQKAGQSITFLK